MRNLLAASSISILVAISAAFGQQPIPDISKFETWTTFSAPAAGFSVRLPAQPTIRKEALADKAPDLLMDVFEVQPGGGRYFFISFADLSGRPNLPELVRAMGGAQFNHLIEKYKGTVLRRRKIGTAGCPGDEATLTTVQPWNGKKVLMTVRSVGSQNRMYMLLYGGADDSALEQQISDNFMDSFTVTTGCTGTDYAGTPPVSSVIEGTLDRGSGWRVINTPVGLSISVPEAMTLEYEKSEPPLKPIAHYTYSVNQPNFSVIVEVFDGFPAHSLQSPGERDARLKGLKALVFANSPSFIWGPARPIRLGHTTGEELSLKLPDIGAVGRGRFFVTPTRSYSIVTISGSGAADLRKQERIVSSVKIDGN